MGQISHRINSNIHKYFFTYASHLKIQVRNPELKSHATYNLPSKENSVELFLRLLVNFLLNGDTYRILGIPTISCGTIIILLSTLLLQNDIVMVQYH